MQIDKKLEVDVFPGSWRPSEGAQRAQFDIDDPYGQQLAEVMG